MRCPKCVDIVSIGDMHANPCLLCKDTGTVSKLEVLIEQEEKLASKENAMSGKHAYALKLLKSLL